MEFILCNIATNDIITERHLYSFILKSAAYGSKISNKKINFFQYNMVLIPYLFEYISAEDEENIKTFKKECLDKEYNEDDYVFYSLYKFFSFGEKLKIRCSILGVVDQTSLDIFYTDGSVDKTNNKASYGTVKLLGESLIGNTELDVFTNTHQQYKQFSDVIMNGTNNIGELNGIKKAVEERGFNRIQVIISDSEYSIKAFREWIYTWVKNNYKNYSKKEISNKELIQEIQQNIEKSGKIYVFKWCKGHSNVPFNEMCDQLAKDKLGIKK